MEQQAMLCCKENHDNNVKEKLKATYTIKSGFTRKCLEKTHTKHETTKDVEDQLHGER